MFQLSTRAISKSEVDEQALCRDQVLNHCCNFQSSGPTALSQLIDEHQQGSNLCIVCKNLLLCGCIGRDSKASDMVKNRHARSGWQLASDTNVRKHIGIEVDAVNDCSVICL